MPKTENLAKKENKIKIGVKTPEHTPTLQSRNKTRIVCRIPHSQVEKKQYYIY